jgi:hypothetical protein
VSSSSANCGACRRTCTAGQACLGGVCISPGIGNFQIQTLGATGCAAIEHNSITGDDRGGIALSTTSVLYNGDSSLGRFNAMDLSSPASAGSVNDGITVDVSTLTPYELLTAAGTRVVKTTDTGALAKKSAQSTTLCTSPTAPPSRATDSVTV